jgi:hypothetical protein
MLGGIASALHFSPPDQQPEGKSIPLCAADMTRNRAERWVHSTLVLKAFLQNVNSYVLISERASQNGAWRW